MTVKKWANMDIDGITSKHHPQAGSQSYSHSHSRQPGYWNRRFGSHIHGRCCGYYYRCHCCNCSRYNCSRHTRRSNYSHCCDCSVVLLVHDRTPAEEDSTSLSLLFLLHRSNCSSDYCLPRMASPSSVGVTRPPTPNTQTHNSAAAPVSCTFPGRARVLVEHRRLCSLCP
jgi:hypothetical protein